jgi:heptaprenyl diphosphate synthase
MMDRKKKDAVRVILICNAILISLLELVIPIPIPLPGVKLGLGNIITLVAVAFLQIQDVLIIVVIRCIVVALLSKGVTMLIFSLSGGLVSAAVMWLVYKYRPNLLSIKGISVIGAVTHNITQLGVAALILSEAMMVYYLPVLLITAIVTGLITGTISELTIAEVKKRHILP